MNSAISQKLKVLNLIYFAQPVMLAAFSIIVLYINLTNPVGNAEDYHPSFIYIPFILLVICFPASNFVQKIHLSSGIKGQMNLDQKLAIYQVATIIRAGILELGGLFGVVFTLLTAQNELLVIAVFDIILFVITRPTLFRLKQALDLSNDELRNQ